MKRLGIAVWACGLQPIGPSEAQEAQNFRQQVWAAWKAAKTSAYSGNVTDASAVVAAGEALKELLLSFSASLSRRPMASS
jgi:hypothetical protein